jgi:hypothetical protein
MLLLAEKRGKMFGTEALCSRSLDLVTPLGVFYIAICLQTFRPYTENVFLVMFPHGFEIGVYFMDRRLSCVTYSLLYNVLLGFL